MLTGKLVRLRKPEPGDLDRVVRWMNDAEVTHFIAARYPYSALQEAQWIERMSTQPPSEGVLLAIERLDDGRHIGNLGLARVEWEDRRASVGIAIGEKDCWGHGYGTDAMQTLLRFAFDAMNLHRVTLDVHASNARAIASYEKTGFIREGALRQAHYQQGRYEDLVAMGILADEFYAIHGRTQTESS